MKYAVAYHRDGQWNFLKHGPTKEFPHGLFGTGMRIYDTRKEAISVRLAIVEEPNDKRLPFVSDDRLAFWKETIKVVPIPDEAVAKFEEARRLTDWCFENPKAGVPEGSRENSLFHRGREIGEIGREGQRILMDHLKKWSGNDVDEG
jgi:hypothetical protein